MGFLSALGKWLGRADAWAQEMEQWLAMHSADAAQREASRLAAEEAQRVVGLEVAEEMVERDAWAARDAVEEGQRAAEEAARLTGWPEGGPGPWSGDSTGLF